MLLIALIAASTLLLFYLIYSFIYLLLCLNEPSIFRDLLVWKLFVTLMNLNFYLFTFFDIVNVFHVTKIRICQEMQFYKYFLTLILF